MTDTFSHEQSPFVQEKRKHDFLAFARSLSLALAIGAEPNTCFDNVLRMFKDFPEIVAEGRMVEGWYVVDLDDEVVVNEHGWCELADGRIIDPTVVLLLSPSQPVYYFPGVQRSWQEVHDLVQKDDVFFPYVRCEGTYGEDGLQHPVYRAAHEAARQKAFSLARGTQPPKVITFLSAQDLADDQRDPGGSLHIFIVSGDQNEGGEGV